MPDAIIGLGRPDDRPRAQRRRDSGAAPGEDLAMDGVTSVLRALAAMARSSRRHEADVQSAIRGAGLTLSPDQQDQALRELVDSACIDRIVPLVDGGILLSVTAEGMSRAGQADEDAARRAA
jgi:hypothetical protein